MRLESVGFGFATGQNRRLLGDKKVQGSGLGLPHVQVSQRLHVPL